MPPSDPTQQLSFGVMLGQLLERSQDHSKHLSAIDAELAKLKERLHRLAILAGLWAAALAANASTDQLSGALATLLQLAFQSKG